MDDEAVKFYQLTKQAWVHAVRTIAPVHGVDADELLNEIPSFPVDPTKPGQPDAAFTELRLKSEDEMTRAELVVCMLPHEAMVEAIWQSIKSKRPKPDFSEGESSKSS
jgi:hypothetical protein